MTHLRRCATVLLVLALASALSACEERDEPTGTGTDQRVNLALDAPPNANHAGIYAAIGTREFDQAALDVKLRAPSGPADPLAMLARGRVDLAISHEPELLLARDRGARLVSVAELVQRPLTALLSVGGEAVRDPAQLGGRKVGTGGLAFQEAYLQTILQDAGVPAGSVREVDVGFGIVRAMLSDRVNATFGGLENIDGVELERRRRDPTIRGVSALGVPGYAELVIVAREQDVRSNGPLIRRFLRALARGHERLRRDPDTGIDTLKRRNPDLRRSTLRRQLRATLDAFRPSGRDRPFGFHSRREWRRHFRWMRSNDLLDAANVERAFTNEFLPGEGV